MDETKKFKVGKYIPAFLRRYPFVLVQDEAQNNFSLGIEEGALEPLSASNQERALFKEDKTPSDLSKNTLDFLMRFHERCERARRLLKS